MKTCFKKQIWNKSNNFTRITYCNKKPSLRNIKFLRFEVLKLMSCMSSLMEHLALSKQMEVV